MKATLLLVLVCFATCCFGQKKQRLIAQSRYLNADSVGCCTFVFRDSSTYKYSGARHSRNDFVSLSWSYFMSDPQGGSYTPLRLINGIVKPNNIDSLQYASAVDFDTTAYYELDSNGKPIMKDSYTYDHYPDGKLRHLGGSAGFDEDYIYYFGDLYRQRQVYKGQDTSWRLFIHDAFGNVVLDYYGRYYDPASTYFSIGSIAQFEFDSLNRYTSHSESWGWYPNFFPEYRDYYEYYPDNRVKKLTHGGPHYPDSIFHPVFVDSFGYTPGVPGYTSRNFYFLWAPNGGYYDVTHINARGLVDTLVRTWWHPQDTTRHVFVIEYNSEGNPIVITKGYERCFYYYEDYDPSLSTQEVANNTSLISLSPNPATSNLTLHYSQPLPNSAITISISNITGQMLQRTSLIPQGMKTDIPLSEGIPAGMYSISVRSKGNPPIFRGNFLKL